MSDRMWYEDYQKELADKQQGKTRAEIAQELQAEQDETGQPLFTHVFDPDNAPKQGHFWVDRGLKYSCEGAGHANHQAWKRRR